MTLKWTYSLLTVVAVAVCATANIVAAQSGASVPVAVNVILIAVAALGATLAAVIELHLRLEARLSALSDFLVTRLDEITVRLDDLESDNSERTIEAYLGPIPAPTTAGHASVVPLMARASRGYPRGVPPETR